MNDSPQTRCLDINPKLERGKIFPVFIPFAGCPHHCIFCAQESQTGKGKQDATKAIAEAERAFPKFLANAQTPLIDIAFYGGTFTAISDEDFSLCLAFFEKCKKQAQQHGVTVLGRCSTRPDALPDALYDALYGALYKDRLNKLRSAGIDLIELGIQSFDDTVLSLSSRAYTKENAQKGCQTVLENGFKLGIQLMAGLPEQNEAVFLNDVKTALSLKPHCLRYYPCLVPEQTALAKLYRAQKYAPWTNEQCIKTLGYALAMAWKAKIPVIRLTVAPEQEFDTHLVAGPRHPALGSDIMGYALYVFLKEELAALERPAQNILIPAKYQGCFFGSKNYLKNEYAKFISLGQLTFIHEKFNKIKIYY